MPLVLDEKSALGKFVSTRNLGRQYGFLHTSYEIWRRGAALKIDHRFICELNFYAVQFLSPAPGIYREADVEITNSDHDPPRWKHVSDLMVDFLRQLSRRSGKGEAEHAAAYALWRLNWIHPFMQGNGRAARALSYFVLCKELKMWAPGKLMVPERIRRARKGYEDGLAHADATYKNRGSPDLDPLAQYLADLLKRQLEEAVEKKRKKS